MKNPLVEFVETHKDWQELLSKSPYNIKIRQDGDCYLFSYHLFESDFYNQVVKHSRGSILRINWPDVEIVCWPFNKFHNYGEGPADKIDLMNARALEKIDGSLIKLYHDGNKWQWATNNGFNANAELPGFTPVCNELGTASAKTFQDLIDYAIQDKEIPWDELDTDFCFMLELVSPRNRIVVPYDKTELYMLGARKMDTGDEWIPEIANELLGGEFKTPKTLKIAEIEEAVKLADKLDANNEGFVVVDHQFNRVKVKGAAYLSVHHLKGEKQLSWDHLFECILQGTSDDIKAYFPEMSAQVERLEQAYNDFEQYRKKDLGTCKHKWENGCGGANPDKEYAAFVMQHFAWISSAAFNVKRKSIDDAYAEFKAKLTWDKFKEMTHFEEVHANS